MGGGEGDEGGEEGSGEDGAGWVVRVAGWRFSDGTGMAERRVDRQENGRGFAL